MLLLEFCLRGQKQLYVITLQTDHEFTTYTHFLALEGTVRYVLDSHQWCRSQNERMKAYYTSNSTHS